MEPIDKQEYVRWAYRLLLGREPESEDVVENNPYSDNSFLLLQNVLHCPEFLQRCGATFAVPPHLFLIHEGSLRQTRQFIMSRSDPVRDMTVALALETIGREKIDGDLAELGVYQGEMALLYQKVLPDKRLYLFDTFAGFPKQDLQVSEDNRFSDTSLDWVKTRLGDSANVVFKPGYFPDTSAGMEDSQFCFVMLDADLYNPTKAGLEFFYPRITPGGYVFLHDYTSYESNEAVRRATSEFLADKPERVIEIADTWGTALFRKL
jgi:O-methyltransferase